MVEPPLMVSVREAARTLGVGRDAAYRLVREKRLRAVRIGRRIYVPRAELVALIERETAAVEGEA